jgi:uncharacterized membrane protein
MITANKDLMRQAREALEGKWGLAIGVTLVYVLIVGGVSAIFSVFRLPNLGSIATLIIGGPLVLGVSGFFLGLSRRREVKFSEMFNGFNHFGVALGTYLLMTLFVVLWLLLLIVPGIIASIAYSQTFFILAEDPTLSPMQALRKSKKMMYGYKWKYFCLTLRFIGWALLCVLTLGLGFIVLMPYIQASFAKFYDDVKANYVEVV